VSIATLENKTFAPRNVTDDAWWNFHAWKFHKLMGRPNKDGQPRRPQGLWSITPPVIFFWGGRGYNRHCYCEVYHECLRLSSWLKPCPHCRRKVRLSPKTATVAEFGGSRTFQRQCGQSLARLQRVIRAMLNDDAVKRVRTWHPEQQSSDYMAPCSWVMLWSRDSRDIMAANQPQCLQLSKPSAEFGNTVVVASVDRA